MESEWDQEDERVEAFRNEKQEALESRDLQEAEMTRQEKTDIKQPTGEEQGD